VWKVSAYIVDISVDGLGQVAALFWEQIIKTPIVINRKTIFLAAPCHGSC
jgi:hypothetical protein